MSKTGRAVPITLGPMAQPFQGYRTLPLKASEAVTEGQPINIASGYVDPLATDPAGTIDGFADHAVTSQATAGAESVRFIPVKSGLVLKGTLLGVTLAQTDLYAAVGLTLDATSGLFVWDKAAVNKNFRIVGWDTIWDIGDTSPVVHVEPLKAALA